VEGRPVEAEQTGEGQGVHSCTAVISDTTKPTAFAVGFQYYSACLRV